MQRVLNMKKDDDSVTNVSKEFQISAAYSLCYHCGKLLSGVINSARLKAKYDYKCAIKQAAIDCETANTDEISDFLNCMVIVLYFAISSPVFKRSYAVPLLFLFLDN